jgi:hypothetical protein
MVRHQGKPEIGSEFMQAQRDSKVLIVIEGGMASVYAEHGVRVAIADLDNLKVDHSHADIAIHSDFSKLLSYAEVDFPISDHASTNQAEVIVG